MQPGCWSRPEHRALRLEAQPPDTCSPPENATEFKQSKPYPADSSVLEHRCLGQAHRSPQVPLCQGQGSPGGIPYLVLNTVLQLPTCRGRWPTLQTSSQCLRPWHTQRSLVPGPSLDLLHLNSTVGFTLQLKVAPSYSGFPGASGVPPVGQSPWTWPICVRWGPQPLSVQPAAPCS